jgi:general secretion pathway protein M
MIKRLNPRERQIVLAGLVALGLMLAWFALLNPYLEAMANLDRRIAASQRNLDRAQQLQGRIARLKEELARVGPEQQGGGPLFSRVEGLTVRTGVREQLLSMRPQPATTQGGYRQQLVEIRLEKLRLAQLVKLLFAVEYRSGGIQVKSMRVKPRFENRSSLDVNMVLMSLEKP